MLQQQVNDTALTPALALLPAGRSSNGTPLYDNPCPSCGKDRLSDSRKLGKLCMACSNKSRATHGLTRHPLYLRLMNIKARCTYPSATNYAYYGGRGIKVCEEWLSNPKSFVEWAEAQGWTPGLEVDRIDNDGNYDPSNCQLVDHATNSRKRSNARCDERKAAEVKSALASGMSVKEAAQKAGVPYMSAWHISKGRSWN